MSESKVIKKISDDLAALGKVTAEIKSKRTPQLKKHLMELGAFRADRAKAIRDITAQVDVMEKEAEKLEKKFKEALKSNSEGVVGRLKTLQKFKLTVAELKSKKKILEEQDKKAKEIIDASRTVLDDFETIGQKKIEGLPSTWSKLRENLGGGTEGTLELLSQVMGLAAELKK